MPAKQVVFGDEARAKIVAGVNLLARAVRCTLGPKARTVVLQRSYGAPVIINSGVIVAREIELADPLENMGAQMVREVASKTSDVAGDGTTTAILLAQGLVAEGMKHVAAGMNPMDLKRGIDLAVDSVVGGAEAPGAALREPHRDRPGRHHLGQQRPGDRRDRRQRHGEGRQGRRHHGRGRHGARERDGGGRGHAVRPRLPLALLHQHRREDARGAGGRLHPPLRPQDRQPARDAAGAGTGGQGRQAAPHRGRGRRGRGARHAGGEHAARRAQDLRGEGARLRRPAQGDAGGPRRSSPAGASSRRRRGLKLEKAEAHRPRARAPHRGRQGRHDDHRRRRRPREGPGPRGRDQAAGGGRHERLRQGEAAGARGEARGRRGRRQGGRRHGNGDEGAQGARRGCAARHARGGRGGRPARRRRGAAARPRPARRAAAAPTPTSNAASRSCCARSRSRCARSWRTPATSPPWCWTACWPEPTTSASTP